ncbi:MAG TPA: alcohol dehydrogenase catalytic domain-containing protein [Nitriliruptoraceae bacterium]|nr:alcohol dehydrogenase catalytic domain-containing protein [Nitriliruptoraceae bacterium]
MKALVYHGPDSKAWEEVPEPTIQDPTDAIVKIETTTICGTDLHILKGDVPAVTDGRILGHEAVGVVTDVGSDVIDIAVGDRVIVSCISKCGTCDYCAADMPSHCTNLGGIGWIFGHLIDGTQAEYVRVPYADNGLIPLPEGVTDEQGVMLSDILPTGFEIGVTYGEVGDGDVVAVVGVGPVGLAAIMTAGTAGASRVIAVDGNAFRLEKALEFGATDAVNINEVDDVAATLREMSTDGLGVDVAIEAVGVPATWDTCLAAIRPGGHVANVGVHGTPVSFPIEEHWINNITITTGLVNAVTTEELLDDIQAGRIAPEKFTTHRFALDDIMEAYDVFANAVDHDTLKVILTAS